MPTGRRVGRGGVGVVAGAVAVVAIVVVGAGAAAPAADDPPVEGYEIVRASFMAGGEDVEEGVARCSAGKFVMGGGARVVDSGGAVYLVEGSDPAGPSGWAATFRRLDQEPPEEERPDQPILPPPGAEPEPEPEPEPEAGPAARFEISAVCGTVR